MSKAKKNLNITDVVLRDAHQSLFATRLRLDDMLPIAEKIDRVGFWSVETWGGATFDACIRYLGEDPWHRIRSLKAVMPNTPQQMLLRGQNLLGYRHYADDVVTKFVERAARNGVDVFRVFDAMNDCRNMETAIKAVRENDRHAQGTIAYTLSPVHNIDTWTNLAKRIEAMGAHSLCIKDMAGLLQPYSAYDLITSLKKNITIPVQLHAHATTGLSTATIIKCVEAGIDTVDTAISSMSMTYGHSPTETIVSIFAGSEYDTGLDIDLLQEIADYFREVRKKYMRWEGSLKGIDPRILIAQVPGGMLTNMENQLREQGAQDRFADVLAEIPRVRKDLGYIPLVTPTSQIVGTQAVLNVLAGERYKRITTETEGILKGEYGEAPAAFDEKLQQRVLNGKDMIRCRPADLLDPEIDNLTTKLRQLAEDDNFQLGSGEHEIDDVLTYTLFAQIGLQFLKNRDNPDAFEPTPSVAPATNLIDSDEETYTITVNGQRYITQISKGGDVSDIAPVTERSVDAVANHGDNPISAPLAGTVWQIAVTAGQTVQEGDLLIILEAMKMETQIIADKSGVVSAISVQQGDTVKVGDVLLSIA